MTATRKLSDSQLSSYAEEHLQYEIDMLIWSAGILAFLTRRKAEGWLPWAINNGLMNSFALHARNLINFLYSRGNHSSDVVLKNYLSEDTISQHLPLISELFEEALLKANKQAAHLTMERIDYDRGGKEWRFIELAREILAVFRKLAPHIPSTKMSKSLIDKFSREGFRIPEVQISTAALRDGSPVEISFSLKVSENGSAIKSVSV